MATKEFMENMPKDLVLPPRTITGHGEVTSLCRECRIYGSRGLIVHGQSLARSGILEKIIKSCPESMEIGTYQHQGTEPTVQEVEDLLASAREMKTNWIAAIGGGSVIDLAKTAASLYVSDKPVQSYHDGTPLLRIGGIPFIAVPTTAGTGSEATIVTVLTNANGVKKSIRHHSFMARLIILDPALLKTCPPLVIASSGMDALTQAIESNISISSTYITTQWSIKAIELISSSIEKVFYGEADDNTLTALLTGSYLAGIALSNARLGLVHGLAHPLGSRYKISHGRVCASCLLPVTEYNREFIKDKYDAMSQAAGKGLSLRIAELVNNLGIESPFKGQPIIDKPGIIRETLASGSTAANPRPVTEEDISGLLDNIFSE